MSGEVKITQKLERWVPYDNTVKVYDLNGVTIYYEDFHDGYVLEIPREIGKKYFEIKEKKSQHELDAIVSALIGKLYLKNKTIAVGNKKEGVIIIPKTQIMFSRNY